MKTAQQAREATKLAFTQFAKETLLAIRETVDVAVNEAAAKGMSQASVTLSADISPELLQGIQRAYKAGGFRVKVETRYGYMAYNLVKPPTVTITLAW